MSVELELLTLLQKISRCLSGVDNNEEVSFLLWRMIMGDSPIEEGYASFITELAKLFEKVGGWYILSATPEFLASRDWWIRYLEKYPEFRFKYKGRIES